MQLDTGEYNQLFKDGASFSKDEGFSSIENEEAQRNQKITDEEIQKFLRTTVGTISASIQGQTLQGKGVLIFEDIVLTSASFLYDRQHKKHAQKITFTIKVGNAQSETYDVIGRFFPSGYQENEDNYQSFNYAFLKLKQDTEIYGYLASNWRQDNSPKGSQNRELINLNLDGKIAVDEITDSLISFQSDYSFSVGDPLILRGQGIHVVGVINRANGDRFEGTRFQKPYGKELNLFVSWYFWNLERVSLKGHIQKLQHKDRIKKTKKLYLYNNGLEDNEMNTLCSWEWESLVYLTMERNKVTSKGLEKIENLKKLQQLHISHNKIDAQGLIKLVKMKYKKLSIKKNAIKNEEKQQIQKVHEQLGFYGKLSI